MAPATLVRIFALAAFVLSSCDADDDWPDAGKDHHTSDAGKDHHTSDAGKNERRDASTDAGIRSPVFAECAEGKTFPINASDYDQSCGQDSDCIGIGEGDGCDCRVVCRNAAINSADEAKWRKDLAETPAHAALCLCPAAPVPCCLDQRCSSDLLKCQPHTNDDAG
jgi:hypothetical protein